MQITKTTVSFNDGAEAAQFFAGILTAVSNSSSIGLMEKVLELVAVTDTSLKDAKIEQAGQAVGATQVEQEPVAPTNTTQTEVTETGKSPRKTATARKDNKPVSTPTTATEGEGGVSAKNGESDSPKESTSTETVSQNSKSKQVTYDEVRDALFAFADDICLLNGTNNEPEYGRLLFVDLLTKNIGVPNVKLLIDADMGKLTDVFNATLGEGPYALDAEVYKAIAKKKAALEAQEAEQASEV